MNADQTATATEPTDEELVQNIQAADAQETLTQKKINKATAKLIAFKVVVPLAVAAGVVYVLNRRERKDEETHVNEIEENTEEN